MPDTLREKVAMFVVQAMDGKRGSSSATDAIMQAVEEDRAALVPYLHHQLRCKSIQVPEDGDCTCGLDAALAGKGETERICPNCGCPERVVLSEDSCWCGVEIQSPPKEGTP